VKKLVSSVFVLFFVITGVFAQQKYGHINSQEILETMPEYKQLNASMETKKKQYNDQLQKMMADYQQKSKEINDFGGAMMEAVRQERMKEIETLQQSISSFQEDAEAELQKSQLKLMKPLNDKYLKVVQAVAKENGYAYIFDLNSGMVVYHPENTGDVTDLVKKKMGIN
jgi:outer membrane protein